MANDKNVERAAKLDTTHNGCIGPHGGAPPQNCLLVQRVAVHLGPRIRDIRQDAGRTEKHIVFNRGSRVDGDVVLNLDIASNHDVIRHLAVLAENAAFANPCALRRRG